MACGCSTPNDNCIAKNSCNILMGNKVCIKNVQNTGLCNPDTGINFYRDTNIQVDNVDSVCIKSATFKTIFNDPNCSSSCDLSSIDLSQFCTQLNVQEIWNDLKALKDFDWNSYCSDYMSYKAFITEISGRLGTFIQTANEWLRRSTCMFCDIYHRIQDLVDRVTALEKCCQDVLKRLDLIEKIIGYPYDLSKGTIQDRLNNLEDCCALIKKWFGNYDFSKGTVEDRLSHLEQCCVDIRNELDGIHDQITDIYNKITDIYNKIANINNEISNIWNVINNINGGGGSPPSGYIRIFKTSQQLVCIPWSNFQRIVDDGSGIQFSNAWWATMDTNQPIVMKSDMTGILNVTFTSQVIENMGGLLCTFNFQNAAEFTDHYQINFDVSYLPVKGSYVPSNLPFAGFKFPAKDYSSNFPPSQEIAQGIYVVIGVFGYKDVPLQ